MVISLNALVEPVGSIKSWFRADTTTPLPSGWLICDGITVSDVTSVFDGKAIPDLRSRFPRGHSTLNNGNFGADVNYFAGGALPAGGSNTIALSHAHGVPNHSHSINSHAHSFNVGNHAHNIPGTTGFNSQVGSGFSQPGGVIGPGPGPNGHNHITNTNTGSAGAAGGNTNSAAGSIGSGGSGTNSSLGSPGIVPPFEDYVTIIKYK